MTESEPSADPAQAVEPEEPDRTDRTKEHVPSDWEAEGPVPLRYWWLKRVGLVIGLLVLILAGLRWWWGWDAHRRLQAEVDRIVAAGEPIYPQDFDPPEPVPDAENAARFVLDAEIALSLTPDDEALIAAVVEDRLTLYQRLDEVKAVVEKNVKALDLVRQARSRTRVDWGLRIRTPAIATMYPSLSGQRWLVKLLSATAGYYHVNGDDAAVIGTLRDALTQVRAIDSGPTLISHLLAIAASALAVNRVERVAPSLVVRAQSETMAEGERAASREEFQALITDLLAEDGTQKALVRAMQSERMSQLDTIKAIVDGQMTPNAFFGRPPPGNATTNMNAILLFVKRPLYEHDAMFGLAWMTKYVAAARSSDRPTAAAVAPVKPGQVTEWERILHPISWTELPWVDRTFVLHFRALAMRRMAATALAIRLYEIDHGRWPSALSDLVSEYLPTIPADPFADDGRPISYCPDATPPVLYSIGQDGVDDGGAYTFRKGGGINWDELDMPFFLDGNRPRKPES